MSRINQTDLAIQVIERLPTVEARMEYQRSLPKGIGARVLGRLLDNTRARANQERYHRELMAGFRAMIEAERRPYDPFERVAGFY